MNADEFGALPEEEREELRVKADDVQHSIAHVVAEMRRLNKVGLEQARAVDKEVVQFTLSPLVDDLKAKYAEFPVVVGYLDQVASDMVEQLEIFKPKEESSPSPEPPDPRTNRDVFERYRVNDLVDNTTCEGAPVVFEYSPTYYNLFGRIGLPDPSRHP